MLIVGLGNHESCYLKNRHNIGRMTLERIAKGRWLKVKSTMITKEDDDMIFAYPLSYMNLSGPPVQQLLAFYKIAKENLLVIHDDIDLPIGEIRFKCGGGSGGHNGIKSIDQAIGNEYHRMRIGVGRPENRNIDVSDWVLSDFHTEELALIEKAIDQLPDFLSIISKS